MKTLVFLGALSLFLGLACAGLPVPTPTPAPFERGVHTPDDLRRYLAGFPERYVFVVDEDVAVLFADPNSLAEWVGAAFIYHIPSVSSVTLDWAGTITGRRYNAAEGQKRLEAVLADEVLMDRIRSRIEEIWGPAQ